METIGMRRDHADFQKSLRKFEESIIGKDGLNYSDSYLVLILYNLEKRIRELEFKINEK
jgi:hypothetical protein